MRRSIQVRNKYVFLGLGLLLMLWANRAAPVSAQSDGVTWQPPFSLSNTPENSEYPAIASDDFGYVHVFWSEDLGGISFAEDPENPRTGNAILYARWDGTAWTTPMDILFSPDDSIASDIAVDVDANNRLHTVWNGQTNFYYSNAPSWQANSAQAWSRPIIVATGSARSRGTASIVADATGVLHIVYATRGNEAGIYHIFSQDEGVTWNTPLKLSESLDSLEKSFSNVQIITDGAGRLHVVWQTNQQEGYGQAIYYIRSVDKGQTWSLPLQLRYRGAGDTWVELPFLAARGDSELHLIYVDGTNVGRAYRISMNGGETWSESQSILTELEGINGYVFPLVDGAGQLHLIVNMRTRDQLLAGIFYARWLGDGWSRAEPLVVGADEGGAHATAGTVRLGNELHIAWSQIHKGEIGYISGRVASVAQTPPRTPPTSPLTSPLSATAEPGVQKPVPLPTRMQPPVAVTTSASTGFEPNPLLVASGLSLLVVCGGVLWARRRRP